MQEYKIMHETCRLAGVHGVFWCHQSGRLSSLLGHVHGVKCGCSECATREHIRDAVFQVLQVGKGCDILQTERLKLKFKTTLDIISGDFMSIHHFC